jgi:branched-chain amino acid transport system permease protein
MAELAPAQGAQPAPGALAWRRHALPLSIFLALALAPIAAKLGPEGYILSLLTRVMIFAIAAVSLDLLLGYGGLISFGHAGFVGLGAYAVAIPMSHGLTDISVHLAGALGACALVALATGAISLRTKGVYFIMITLAFGQMLFFLATSLAPYGGDDGLTLPSKSLVLGARVFRSEGPFYYVVFAALVGVYGLCRAIVASRFGRVLRGTRENAVRMAAIGFDPFRYQLAAYVIAAMIAGVAGVLLTNQAEFVSPAYMTWQRSGELIFMVILGGLGTLHGAILGAAAFLLLEEVLAGFTEHWKLIFGPLLIVIVIVGRGGLTGLLGHGRDG